VAATIGILIFAALSTSDGRDTNDIQSLIATIEALQRPVHDFRCEYEGTTYLKGKNAETTPVGADGLFEIYRGTLYLAEGRRHPQRKFASIGRKRPDLAPYIGRARERPSGV